MPVGPDALEAYQTVRSELEAYKPEVAAKPELVAANKLDLPGAREGLERLRAALPERKVVGVSTVTNEGVPALLEALSAVLASLPQPEAPATDHEVRVYRLAPREDEGFSVEAVEPDVYRVRGRRVERGAKRGVRRSTWRHCAARRLPSLRVEKKADVAKHAPKQVHSSTELLESVHGKAADAPLCFTCGTKMRPAGSCYVCEGCGTTSGCS